MGPKRGHGLKTTPGIFYVECWMSTRDFTAWQAMLKFNPYTEVSWEQSKFDV